MTPKQQHGSGPMLRCSRPPLPGKLDAIQPLLDAGARVGQMCEGSPPLNMAVCVGSHPAFYRFALSVSSMLLDAGAVPLER